MRKRVASNMSVNAVLFDLDGTLLDTAPDLAYAINRLREENQLQALPFSEIRQIVSLGSKVMLKLALGMEETHPNFSRTREHFFSLYQKHLADSTRFFPQMEQVLDHLEKLHIPWGIVTNKLTKHTLALLKALSLEHRPVCIVCGDTLPKYKPDPEPILHACELIQAKPNNCLYIGDSATDVIASKAAGTKSLVALYGYISDQDDPLAWQADGYVKEPLEILNWL